ncbi:molybdenum cofactor synthesis domain protein [Ignisphaera aggregans DSM 17230]|uniref:Molybdenum cofactor synthesis domain protein n=1 Tax=Ignisphaera aggregans (strain DSM 17230 / JCM 13409 / AQ1.S1) TaxID=583356 RepID=E0ST58_IGNAA|nr:molybdenum cofactor synthesis domain protein [Ignisphaera aggregans DSM 17230]
MDIVSHINRVYEPIDKAIAQVVKASKFSLDIVEIGLINALGRIAAEDVVSPINFPPFNRSAVDGYAICSDSITSASPANPIPLRLRGKMEGEYTCNDAVEIHTGEKIPEPFDAVVMLEDVYVAGNSIYVMRSVPRYANISIAGEDFKIGEILIEKGVIVRPWHIAMLSTIGRNSIKVYRELNIGVITTGSEVRDSDAGIEAYEKGYILDSTSKLVLATLSEYRFIKPRWYGIYPDDINMISKVLLRALDENEIVITTGGTGPGGHDVTHRGVRSIGAEIIVQGIAMRPGRPTSIAIYNGKPIFMLSGFPVAAYIGVKILVLTFISRYLGIKGIEPLEIRAKLLKRVTGVIGYNTFVRVKVYRCGEELCVEPIMLRGSGILSSLAKANGFLEIPSNVEGFEKGDYVWIQML